MNPRRTLAIARKEILHIVRDTRSQGLATPPSPELFLDVRQLELW